MPQKPFLIPDDDFIIPEEDDDVPIIFPKSSSSGSVPGLLPALETAGSRIKKVLSTVNESMKRKEGDPTPYEKMSGLPAGSTRSKADEFLGKAWETANIPAVSVSPYTRQAMESFREEHPYLGRVGEFGVNTMLAGSSPLGLGLEAATGGTALAAKFGRPAITKALRAPGRVVAATAAAHGAARTGTGLVEGNYPEAVAGALETGIGALAYKAHGKAKAKSELSNVEPYGPHPEPYGPIERPYGPELPPVEKLNIQNRMRDPKYPPADSFDAGIIQEPEKIPNVPRKRKPKINAGETPAKQQFAADVALDLEAKAGSPDPNIEVQMADPREQRVPVTVDKPLGPVVENKGPVRATLDALKNAGEETGAIGPGADKLIKERRDEAIRLKTELNKLDKANAPDEAYQQAISPGLRSMRGEGESWRSNVVKWISSNNRAADKMESELAIKQTENAPPPRPASDAGLARTRRGSTPAEDLAADSRTQSLAARYNAGRASGEIPPDLNFFQWSRTQPVEAIPNVAPLEQPVAEKAPKVKTEAKVEAPPILMKGEITEPVLRANEVKEFKPTTLPDVVPPSEPTSGKPFYERAKAIIGELDKQGVPDSQYRDILSTGSKDRLKKGETWRGKVLEYIEADRAANAPKRYDRRGHISGKFIKKDIPYEPDSFDAGKIEVEKPNFSHSDFLSQLKDSLLVQGKKILKNEKGAITLPNLLGPSGRAGSNVRSMIREWGGEREAANIPPDRFANEANLAYERRSASARKAAMSSADTKLRNYLESIGIQGAKKANLGNPKLWEKVGLVDQKAANMLENYYSRNVRGLHDVAQVFSGTKNLALTGGAPGRTGQVSAHGINILRSDVQARGIVKAIQNYGEGSIDPQVKLDYVKNNKDMLRKLVQKGMTWTDIEGHSALGPIDTAIDKIPYLGAANKARRTLFEKPLFEIHLPATKLKMGIEKYHEMVAKGKSESEALKYAADWANDFSGSVNTKFRHKAINDVGAIALLAPHWTESRAKVAWKGIAPKSMGGVEGYGKPMLRGAAMSAPGVIARIITAGGLYNYLMGSKPAESTSIPAGETSLKKRNIDPLGTAVEPTRLLIQALTQEAQGELGFPFEYIGNKTSMPLQLIENLTRNIDPFENPIWGKDRYDRPIPKATALANIMQEISRPVSMSFMQSLIDVARKKATPEEALSKALELPISYTYKSKPKKKSSSGLHSLK